MGELLEREVSINDLYVLVWCDGNGKVFEAICPFDSNTRSGQGLMVYRLKEEAEAAAKHQQESYGDEWTAVAMLLGDFVALRE